MALKRTGRPSAPHTRQTGHRSQITAICPEESVPQNKRPDTSRAPKVKPLPPDFRRIGDTLPGLLEQLAERRRRYQQEEHAREGVTQ